MIIAFPTFDDKGIDGTLADHFGRAPTFTLIDSETNQTKVISNTGEHFGGGYSAPALLIKNGAKTLVCKGLGRKAVALFNDAGIKIFITEEVKVKEAYESFKKDELAEATEDTACPGRHPH